MNFSGTLRINKFACLVLGLMFLLILYWRSGNATAGKSAPEVNLKSLLKAAIFAAERGGRRVIHGKNGQMNVKSKGKTKEGVNDPVTDADVASHCTMYYSLKNTFPKLTIASEEHPKNVASCSDQEVIDLDSTPAGHGVIDYMVDEFVYINDVTVWIDPLDATKEYTEGLYQYVTTMVCVAIKGKPIIGVIHYPFPPRTYWGWYTKRTSVNIPNAQKKGNKEHPTVLVSRSHAGEVAVLAKAAFGEKTAVTAAAGAGFKVMAVVNGTYDIYLHTTAIKKWDVCAGNAMIKAVDGEMTTLKGDHIDYSSTDDVVVTDGLLVTRYEYDHGYYLDKLA